MDDVQMDASKPIVIVGHGPAALLLALEIQHKGLPVVLVPQPARGILPMNPELVSINADGGLPSLFQHSINLWRSASERLGLPALLQPKPTADLASSPGREKLLRDEAVIDALAGEKITFLPTEMLAENLRKWLAGSTVRGAKFDEGGQMLVPNLEEILQTAIAERGIGTLSAAVVGLELGIHGPASVRLTLADGSAVEPSYVVLSSVELAKKLVPAAMLPPLRPARGHYLGFDVAPDVASTLDLPLLVTRLQEGHMLIVQRGGHVDVFYDAILEPRQATPKTEPDDALVVNLKQHMEKLFPTLYQHFGPAPAPAVAAYTQWVTPDFLPALGPWSTQPNIIYSVGWVGREVTYAPAAAGNILAFLTRPQEGIASEFKPRRFVENTWRQRIVTAGLAWKEESHGAAPTLTGKDAAYMNNVQAAPTANAQYAGSINQVEKAISAVSLKPQTQFREKNSKPKVTTAGIKNPPITADKK
ncbi:MAG: FAD-binding oxidoreductase [Proteobacteria bacterium]|nr:FAD-binding oxidoreductase [Pseudomonadota bacterium]